MAWLIIISGYLLGSIPTAYIAGILLKGKDIRKLGDGNVGAANAFHKLGARTGLAVGILDAGKGIIAILIAQAADISQPAILATGVATVIGHNWPIFLSFRGGRGECTTIGVLLTLIPQPMLIVAGPTILALLISHNVILSSAILFIPLPLLCWWFGLPGTLISYSIGLPCLVGFTHFLRTSLLKNIQPENLKKTRGNMLRNNRK